MKRARYTLLWVIAALHACTSLDTPSQEMLDVSGGEDASRPDEAGVGASGIGGESGGGEGGRSQGGMHAPTAVAGASGSGTGGGAGSEPDTGGSGGSEPDTGGNGGSGEDAGEPSDPDDADEDDVTNAQDNCVGVQNTDQADLDDDGLGDVCDPDLDGDSVDNTTDNCSALGNAAQYDLDGDGQGYGCDADDEVVASGALSNWSESDTQNIDTLASAHGAGMELEWSASAANSIWVYARREGLEVANANAASFTAITDATTLAYTNDSLRLAAGEIAVFRNTIRGTYAALRLESASYDGSTWRANMAWLFAGRSTNFSELP